MTFDELKQQLQGLDFSDIANWPVFAKVGAVVILCGVVLGAGFWFDTRGQLDQLEAAEKQEAEFKQSFESKAAQGRQSSGVPRTDG